MNFSPVSGCPYTKIFSNKYFCSFINFYWLLSFVFCVSFFFISCLYTALTEDDDEGPECPLPTSVGAEATTAPPLKCSGM